MQNENDNAAKAIRLLLADQGKTKAWLAKQLSESPFWVGRRMSSDVNFDTEDLGRIAAVFGLTVTDLLAIPGSLPQITLEEVPA